MKVGSRQSGEGADRGGRSRKVTYSLPGAVADELARRSRSTSRTKSLMVAEALAFYFAESDKRALEAEYADVASDRLFQDDNAAVMRDFSVLDAEVVRGKR